MELKFGDIKKLEYDDNMPFELVLADLLYKKTIDVNYVLSCYTNAIDKERHLNAMRFNEACINLTQILGDNFKGKEKQEVIKRAIHTFNLNTSLVPHVHDEKYDYTSDDEKKWDEFCEMIYGTNLNGTR
jgi:fumarylacetoacetate (FAA) hydrolase family protein